jgi:hypothetical protein
MGQEKIIARIARALAEGEAVSALAERLSPTDLQSLLLHVFQQRSRKRTAAELLAQYQRSAMVRPSTADGRHILQVAQAAIDCASVFELIELAPVAPLGINTVLGRVDQNNCLATIRNAEVMADPTTAAALECARRRNAGEHGTLRLCSRSRMLRLQPFDKPGFSPHFDLFSMVSAGRDRGGLQFEFDSLREHIGVYLRMMERLSSLGYQFNDIEVNLSHTARDADLQRRAQETVLAPLAQDWPTVRFQIDTTREQGRTYYAGFCIGVYARDVENLRMNLCDGGFTDWTQRLLSNGKERLFVSAMGIELVPKRFKL